VSLPQVIEQFVDRFGQGLSLLLLYDQGDNLGALPRLEMKYAAAFRSDCPNRHKIDGVKLDFPAWHCGNPFSRSDSVQAAPLSGF
jgi:hypothetical protein